MRKKGIKVEKRKEKKSNSLSKMVLKLYPGHGDRVDLNLPPMFLDEIISWEVFTTGGGNDASVSPGKNFLAETHGVISIVRRPLCQFHK